MVAIMLIINELKKIEINVDKLKSNQELISLMKTLNTYNININNLNENDTNELIKCILIIS